MPFRGRLRWTKHSRSREIPQKHRCDGVRILPLQCRTIPGTRRQNGRFLFQCRNSSTRLIEHLHPFGKRPWGRRGWIRPARWRPGFRAREYVERRTALRRPPLEKERPQKAQKTRKFFCAFVPLWPFFFVVDVPARSGARNPRLTASVRDDAPSFPKSIGYEI